jgi:multidrug efflux pump subunit AcrB
MPHTPSPFSTILSFIALSIIGLALIPQLNIQLSPSRSASTITVNYYWSGSSARNVEQEVTSKLESIFSTMSGLRGIESTSNNNNGNIRLSFKKNADLDAIRFEMATIIRRVYPQLPPGVSYPVISLGAGGSKVTNVLTYTLASGAEAFFIREYAEENIAPKISILAGVSDVSVSGASPFQYVINFDITKARSLNINADEIAAAINNWFANSQAGMVLSDMDMDGSPEEYRLTFQLSASDEPEWSKIPVKMQAGRIIYLSDLAKVRYKEQLPVNYHRINGLNTINMTVSAGEGVNTIGLAKEVKAEINKLRASLPSGYSIILAHDSTEYLNNELVKIGLRTLYSVLILLGFVWLLSRRIRYLFFIASSLFVNLVVAAIFYYLLKLEIHLYSLAGITVSFGIIIDNSIVMIDHYRHHRNKKVFLAILAATLTTIGSLSVIFFLNENQKINLIDFTWVMIVNLALSLFIALFFIPGLLDLAPLKEKKNKVFYRRKRRINRMSLNYSRLILLVKRWNWAFIILFILGFGIPVHWLPQKIEKDNGWARIYNKTVGSEFYKDIRPVFEKIAGGSLRLFSINVYESSFYSDPQRTSLYVRGSMPEGCTVQQMNDAVKIMENYISEFDEIEMFETNVFSYNSSNISIYFKTEHELGYFPYFLKEELISRANSLGGADWQVYGVGQGFSNAIYTNSRSNQIELTGYNYEQLYRYAEVLCDSLERFERVKDLEISGENSWRSTVLHEFVIDFDKELFALSNIKLADYANSLKEDAYSRALSPVFEKGNKVNVVMKSDQSDNFDKWKLNNEPVTIKDRTSKFVSLGKIEKRNTGNSIHKRNQEYRLYVLYNYIGAYQLARMVAESITESMNSWLPMGYKTQIPGSNIYWQKKDKNQYYLIFLVIGIIYFLCAILLESLLQPLAVISMIPVSFIGVFLTVCIFDFNFDQGGYAAFILLCGLSVNSALYIINDYNNFMKGRDSAQRLRIYIKAFNHKIIPVILTIFSTIIGLIPFIVGGQNEVFWFAFAMGTIGGLLFSLLALYLYFPLFIRLNIRESKYYSTKRIPKK